MWPLKYQPLLTIKTCEVVTCTDTPCLALNCFFNLKCDQLDLNDFSQFSNQIIGVLHPWSCCGFKNVSIKNVEQYNIKQQLKTMI